MVCAKVDKILTAMAASCLTPGEIAQKAGVSINIVYRMRRGYMVKLDCFGKVCKALGVRPEDILDYDRIKDGDQKEKQ